MLYVASYAALLVFQLAIAICPIRNLRDLDHRWTLSEAIASATDDPKKQEILVRIAWFESAFRQDVSRCDVKGDRGRSLGTFQIQPLSPSDRRLACGSVEEQVRLALAYVERSAEACPGNVGPDSLAMYVSGTCARGLREAKNRWGSDLPTDPR